MDSIEIEPAIIEGARYFESRVERAYTDPRRNIIIGYAQTCWSVEASSMTWPNAT